MCTCITPSQESRTSYYDLPWLVREGRGGGASYEVTASTQPAYMWVGRLAPFYVEVVICRILHRLHELR